MKQFFKKLTSNQIFIPCAALLLLALFNLIADPSFFKITLDHNGNGDPVLNGYLITILDYGSELASAQVLLSQEALSFVSSAETTLVRASFRPHLSWHSSSLSSFRWRSAHSTAYSSHTSRYNRWSPRLSCLPQVVR